MRKRILIVDDEPYIVMVLRSRLEHHGYEIEEAFTGSEGYDRARKSPYDLMLLDFLLPDMLGNEVCRQIRKNERLKDLPIIMITAFADQRPDAFLEHGAADIIYKPIDDVELLTKIRKHMRTADDSSRS